MTTMTSVKERIVGKDEKRPKNWEGAVKIANYFQTMTFLGFARIFQCRIVACHHSTMP